MTEFGDSYGKTGDNPRDILPAGASKQSHKNNELTIGTSQVTQHIPGYNGFIPHVDVNPKAVEQSVGASVRNTIIKQNIVENQSVRLPGYQGHKPASVVNDRGALRPTCLSTKGESFHA